MVNYQKRKLKYYLSVDIGASSGRHILTYIKNDKLHQQEVYRFKNEMIFVDGSYFWNVDNLCEHIIEGLRICKKLQMIPYSIGIDTWGVDYVLLDKNKNKLHNPYAYRDLRTKKAIEDLNEAISKKELFLKTGIQHQDFNTIYQLMSETNSAKNRAKYFLMIPDYFNFKLTGNLKNEYTNLTTTQLLNYESQQLDLDLVNFLGLKNNIFQEQISAGTFVGNLSDEIVAKVGFDTKVIAIASHDTASAFLARKQTDTLILSSGTWSLLGVVNNVVINNSTAFKYNFTNEGGFNNEYRFLKNIMGLWIIQEVARNLDYKYSYEELSNFAYESNYNEVFDVNDVRFLNPDDMIVTINDYFEENKKQPPNNIKDLARSVFISLAVNYNKTIKQIERITNENYATINILGGGSKNKFLNEMIAKTTKKKVILGPTEATALGNAAVQMIHSKELVNLEEFRNYIKDME